MAESGRDDYDRLIRFTQLEPGEPYFFLRGRDRVAGAAVRAWAAFAYKAGVPAAIVESALQQADRLDAWPTKRLPDADHLDRQEIQALEYQLARRAWNHRVALTPNETVLLAERRGHQQAVDQQRHADRLLVDLVDALQPVLTARFVAQPAGPEIIRVRDALARIEADLARRLGRELDRTPAPAADAGGEVETTGFAEIVEFGPRAAG